MKKKYLTMLLVIVWSGFLLAQQTITGKVTDAKTGEPLIGATVATKDLSVGVTTNIDGAYSIKVPTSTTLLRVSYTGYDPQDITINGQKVINIQLSEGIDIEEVVVVGYGTQKKKEVTGAVAVVDSKAIEKLNPQRVEQALQGQIAGVNVTSTSISSFAE